MAFGSNANPQDARTSADRQRKAYEIGSRLAHSRMQAEAPDDAEALRAVAASDVVVVGGCYDHVERVLGGARFPGSATSSPPAAACSRPTGRFAM
jgi:hypothetical protein